MFFYNNDVYPKYWQIYKKTLIKGLREFIYENYYNQIAFTIENSYDLIKFQKKKKDFLSFATKLIEKIPDVVKTKKDINIICRRKKDKMIKSNFSTIKN